MLARLAAPALVLLAFGACSDEDGVPSPATTTLSDGTTVWKIQEAPCPEGDDCGIGVYINRWYYAVACDGRPVDPLDEATLGATFAVNDDLYVGEARIIEGKGPETLALHVRGGPCQGDRWISSTGRFDDHELDDPPEDPQQRPPDP